MEDIEVIFVQNLDEEVVFLLCGKIKEVIGKEEEVEMDYFYVIEINFFNEQVYLYLG